MAAKRAAILRWTGRGEMRALQSSIEYILKSNGVRARVRGVESSIVVGGPRPTDIASLFENLPGVSWIAAGFTFGSFNDVGGLSKRLAAIYLGSGGRFSVEAEVGAGVAPSDVAGAATSAILDAVRGSRVSVEAPKVRFRVALDGLKGVVGIEVRQGPGGVPVGNETAICLVSGGEHSSVLAWMALLAGRRVRLVHAKLDDSSLRAVAGLYAELSHRVDPRALSLEVLEGGTAAGALVGFVRKSNEPVYGGFHVGGGVPGLLRDAVLAPLYLMPDESFRSAFESLGVRSHESTADWSAEQGMKFSIRSFGGVTSDVTGVLDGLD